MLSSPRRAARNRSVTSCLAWPKRGGLRDAHVGAGLDVSAGRMPVEAVSCGGEPKQCSCRLCRHRPTKVCGAAAGCTTKLSSGRRRARRQRCCSRTTPRRRSRTAVDRRSTFDSRVPTHLRPPRLPSLSKILHVTINVVLELVCGRPAPSPKCPFSQRPSKGVKLMRRTVNDEKCRDVYAVGTTRASSLA